MPKLKTKSAAKKRFKVTASGKVKSKSAFTRHMMKNKSQKMKRQARGTTVMFKTDGITIIKNWLPTLWGKLRKSKPRTINAVSIDNTAKKA
jgi:large subunit ribosomal protein L35